MSDTKYKFYRAKDIHSADDQPNPADSDKNQEKSNLKIKLGSRKKPPEIDRMVKIWKMDLSTNQAKPAVPESPEAEELKKLLEELAGE